MGHRRRDRAPHQRRAVPWLDAPVKRVASLDTWAAYAPQVERAALPESKDVLAAIEQVKAF